MTINDAKSFYAVLKGNPLYKDMEDEEIIAALDDYFLARYRAANADSLMGIKRDRYQFFQGMLAGMLVQAKIFRHHITAEAYNQNVDPVTGKSFKDANKDN